MFTLHSIIIPEKQPIDIYYICYQNICCVGVINKTMSVLKGLTPLCSILLVSFSIFMVIVY